MKRENALGKLGTWDFERCIRVNVVNGVCSNEVSLYLVGIGNEGVGRVVAINQLMYCDDTCGVTKSTSRYI